MGMWSNTSCVGVDSSYVFQGATVGLVEAGEATHWEDVCSYQYTPVFQSNIIPVETVAGMFTCSSHTAIVGTIFDAYVHDGTRLAIQEGQGSNNAFDLRFTFYDPTKECDFIYFDGHYTGGNVHDVRLEIYNNVTATFDVLSVKITSDAETEDVDRVFRITGTLSDYYDSSGKLILRFNHISNGSNAHYFYVDKLSIVKKVYVPKKSYIPNTTIQLLSFDGTAPSNPIQISGAYEITHAYIQGSTISPHFHWIASSTNSGTVNVYLEYQWVNNDGSASRYGTMTYSHIVSTTATLGSPIPSGFGDINGTGMKMGSRFRFRFYRTPMVNGDTYPDSLILEDIGVHVNKDSLGSKDVWVK